MQTPSNSIQRVLRALGVVAVVVAALALLRSLVEVVLGRAEVAAAGAPLRPDEVLSGLVAAVAVLVLLWGVVGLALEVAGLVPGVVGDAAGTASAALTPRLLRRCVGFVLGVGVTAGLAPGASVAAAPETRESRTVASGPPPDPGFSALPDLSDLPDPAWSAPDDRSPATPGNGGPVRPSVTTAPSSPTPAPTRPAATPPPTAATPRWTPPAPTVRPQPDVRLLTPNPESPEPGEVVVRRGDTLWSIAARHLGPLPSDAEIAAAWPAWHDANRHVIGDDPDLLRPGQVLRAPQAVGS